MSSSAAEPRALTDGRLAALLLASFVAAIVVLIGVLPEVAGLALNLVVLAIAALTSSERKRLGGGWWMVLTIGAVVALLGEGLSHLADTPGSVLALIGGVLVAAASVVGFPIQD
ncbi:hypothetical protein BH10ACT11_BH10ACT11_14980 [soil metagenome]